VAPTQKTTFVEMTFDGPGGRITSKDLFDVEDVEELKSVFEYKVGFLLIKVESLLLNNLK
jgi:hypothetical protein